jgi:hypothetical protein
VVVYPSQDFYQQYVDNSPIYITIAVVIAIFVVAVIFVMYDYLASGRSRMLDFVVQRSDAMLTEMRLRTKPYDFQEELRRMQQAWLGKSLLVVIPQEVDRWTISVTTRLGRGTSGLVFKVCFSFRILIPYFCQGNLKSATSDGTAYTDNAVAVKIFSKAAQQLRDGIYMEAMIMAQLSACPHIVKLVFPQLCGTTDFPGRGLHTVADTSDYGGARILFSVTSHASHMSS